jgi:hypothetical protein
MRDTDGTIIEIDPKSLLDGKKLFPVIEEADFCRSSPERDEYYKVRHFVEGMMKWREADAHMWAGPFPGPSCYFRIEDHSRTQNIQTANQQMVSWKEHTRFCLFSFPHDVRLRLSAMFPNDEVDNGSFIEDFPQGDGKTTKVSRTNLTHGELGVILEHCTHREIMHYHNRVVRAGENFRIETPTVERPVKLYMCGNDDTSYTIFCVTIQEALEKLKKLRYIPSNGMLESLGAVFTN